MTAEGREKFPERERVRESNSHNQLGRLGLHSYTREAVLCYKQLDVMASGGCEAAGTGDVADR